MSRLETLFVRVPVAGELASNRLEKGSLASVWLPGPDPEVTTLLVQDGEYLAQRIRDKKSAARKARKAILEKSLLAGLNLEILLKRDNTFSDKVRKMLLEEALVEVPSSSLLVGGGIQIKI